MRRFKLANVLLEVDDFLKGDSELVYRVGSDSRAIYNGSELSVAGTVDFCTYFNAISVEKWRKYARLVTVRLHVEAKGSAYTLETRGLNLAQGSGSVQVPSSKRSFFDASEDYKVREVDMPLADAVVAGFSISTQGEVQLRRAYYYTLVDESQIRDVRLAISTTTFKKEEFVIPNIERIRAGIIDSDELVAQGFHLFVVDNGCTLDAGELSGNGVTVLPNVNAGGAGGFARGMMAAMEQGDAFTHVILMDDDVRMSVESIKRVHALLSLVSSEYSRAFINGAMLQLEKPALQYEDVSHVRKTGGFAKVKPDIHVDAIEGVVFNETIDVEVENAYGAWWFSCIPMSYIREMQLPMPFFVRCDDVEYGLRCKPVYMTMNGISVWHSAFETRFNAAVVCYQYIRNMLITMALHPVSNEWTFRLRYWRLFRLYLRNMDYAAAELWLDGLEDYLAGPERLMMREPFEAMATANAKAEKYRPLGDLDPAVVENLEVKLEWLDGPEGGHMIRKMLLTIPHDRHWFPDFALSDKPGPLNPDVGKNAVPWTKTAMRKCLVALSLDGERGNVRRIDRERHHTLVLRYRDLMSQYRNTHTAVAERYREMMREMTSERFWKRYLGL